MITLLADYMDADALAKVLRVSTKTLAAWERKGLPSFMLRGRKLYRYSAVRQWLETRPPTGGPPEPPAAA